MQLPGQLDSTTLGDLLGALYRERASGVLELVEARGALAGRTHRVHLSHGLVAHVDSPLPVVRLGELLVREGFIDRAQQHRLDRLLLLRPDRRAGEVLIESELATPAVVGAALRHQLRSRLDAVYGVPHASIRFRVATRLPGQRAVELPLCPAEFLSGRPRARERRRAAGNQPQPSRRPPPQPRASLDGDSAGQAGVPRDAEQTAWGTPPKRRQDPVRTRALATLGLSPGASPREVQQAFRRLAVQFHPDRHPSASDGERAALMRRFAELSCAYHALA